MIIPASRLQFEVEDESGTILHRTRQLLRLLKDSYPEVVFAPLNGKPTRPEHADLDLVLIAPLHPPSALLGQLVDGYVMKLLNSDEPGVRVRLARHEFKLELGGRMTREGGRQTLLAHTFETRTKKLVALLRTASIDPRWLRGTSARVVPTTLFGFFISTAEKEAYRGRRGTVHAGGSHRDDGEDH
jgi:hypothetical protein